MDPAQLLGPLTLFALMIVVGLQLDRDDFRRVLATPRAVVVGTLAQLVLLPLMTWAVVSAFGLSPVLGAGAVLLSASPGAAMTNVTTAVAGAHVAFSVTLTAVSSVLAVVTLPGLTALGMRLFLSDASGIRVPVVYIVSQLVVFLLLPIAIGMRIRARRPETAVRYVAVANRVAVIAILGLTALGAATSSSRMPSGADFAWAAAAGPVWTGLAMAIGWAVGALLRLDDDDRFTLLIEFSMRNVALAVVVAVASFERLDLAVFAGVYAMTGFPLPIGLAVLRGRRVKEHAAAPAAVRASVP
jgi:BASS family bile acid:Na+ symporter